jgi:hypothetical protein
MGTEHYMESRHQVGRIPGTNTMVAESHGMRLVCALNPNDIKSAAHHAMVIAGHKPTQVEVPRAPLPVQGICACGQQVQSRGWAKCGDCRAMAQKQILPADLDRRIELVKPADPNPNNGECWSTHTSES